MAATAILSPTGRERVIHSEHAVDRASLKA